MAMKEQWLGHKASHCDTRTCTWILVLVLIFSAKYDMIKSSSGGLWSLEITQIEKSTFIFLYI